MNLSFSKFAGLMTNFYLTREAAVDIYKQGGQLSPSEMNKSNYEVHQNE